LVRKVVHADQFSGVRFLLGSRGGVAYYLGEFVRIFWGKILFDVGEEDGLVLLV